MVDREPPVTLWSRLRRWVVGKPRDLKDQSLFHKLSLIPFLAWVGLGADGLSSSSYGPQEAFLALLKGDPGHEHRYLAVGLAAMTAFTVGIIAFAYSRLIKHFPNGGGGYVVATKLLGRRAGVVSGSALLVDYVLTITVSIAAAGDALFSFLPVEWQPVKLPFEVASIILLTALNIRGVREAVVPLVPVFLVFLVSHVALIAGGIWRNAGNVHETVSQVAQGYHEGIGVLGRVGMLALFARAWSMGGGTYTGIEAVSNGMPIMREPRVHTGRRTMLYMALSLAFTAGGLLLCYLLADISFLDPVIRQKFDDGMTLNAILSESVFAGLPGAHAIVIATLVSEGALLVVGAQAGFIDGPRVLSNMAQDGWVPRRFGSLSERLTAQNGIILMGMSSLAALFYTGGNVSTLVVMYSINVFLTFSLTEISMVRASLWGTPDFRSWKAAILHGVGLLLCVSILCITTYEKFSEGGWLTVIITALFVAGCFLVHHHYGVVGRQIGKLDHDHEDLQVPEGFKTGRVDPEKPTAVLLVGGYGGLGVATLLAILREFKGHYRNVVFVTAGVVDSGAFKGHDEMEALRARAEQTVERYVALARRFGMPAATRYSVGTDVVDELERSCLATAHTFRHVTFFAGKVVFRREAWYHRWLHNETALAVQKRLQTRGLTLVVLPRLVD